MPPFQLFLGRKLKLWKCSLQQVQVHETLFGWQIKVLKVFSAAGAGAGAWNPFFFGWQIIFMKVFSAAGPLHFSPQSLLSELRNGGGSHSTFHILTHSMNLVVNKSGAKRWEETLDSCQILSSVDSQGEGDFNQGKVQNKEKERKSSLAANLSTFL